MSLHVNASLNLHSLFGDLNPGGHIQNRQDASSILCVHSVSHGMEFRSLLCSACRYVAGARAPPAAAAAAAAALTSRGHHSMAEAVAAAVSAALAAHQGHPTSQHAQQAQQGAQHVEQEQSWGGHAGRVADARVHGAAWGSPDLRRSANSDVLDSNPNYAHSHGDTMDQVLSALASVLAEEDWLELRTSLTSLANTPAQPPQPSQAWQPQGTSMSPGPAPPPTWAQQPPAGQYIAPPQFISVTDVGDGVGEQGRLATGRLTSHPLAWEAVHTTATHTTAPTAWQPPSQPPLHPSATLQAAGSQAEGGGNLPGSQPEAGEELAATVPRLWMYGDAVALGGGGAGPMHPAASTRLLSSQEAAGLAGEVSEAFSRLPTLLMLSRRLMLLRLFW